MMIQLDNIVKQYDGTRVPTPVLRGVSLTIAAGERVALTGASGSGKTTLMNIMGLLDAPSAGRLHLDGREAHAFTASEAAEARNRLIGFVFQSFHLLPHFSALDNVALPLLYRGIAKNRRREIAAETLDQVGLGWFLHRRPAELSGGQRQRVAVARAMVGRPKILLADEPTGNLDAAAAREVMDLFFALSRARGMTVAVVTHDPHLASLFPRNIRMHDGRMMEDEAPCTPGLRH